MSFDEFDENVCAVFSGLARRRRIGLWDNSWMCRFAGTRTAAELPPNLPALLEDVSNQHSRRVGGTAPQGVEVGFDGR